MLGRRRRLPAGLLRPAAEGSCRSAGGPGEPGAPAAPGAAEGPGPQGRPGREGDRVGRPPLRLSAADHPRRRGLLPADGGQQLPGRAPHLPRPAHAAAPRGARPELRRLLLHRVLPQPAVHEQPGPQLAAAAAVLLGVDSPGGAGGRPVRAARRAPRSPAAARQGADAGGVRAHPGLPAQLHQALGAEPGRPARLLHGQRVLRHSVLHRRGRPPAEGDEAGGRERGREEVPEHGQLHRGADHRTTPPR